MLSPKKINKSGWCVATVLKIGNSLF
jgi:hypothetical protein